MKQNMQMYNLVPWSLEFLQNVSPQSEFGKDTYRSSDSDSMSKLTITI